MQKGNRTVGLPSDNYGCLEKVFSPILSAIGRIKIFLMTYLEKTLINKLSNKNLVNNDNDFQRFCHISLKILKSMLVVIKCPF